MVCLEAIDKSSLPHGPGRERAVGRDDRLVGNMRTVGTSLKFYCHRSLYETHISGEGSETSWLVHALL